MTKYVLNSGGLRNQPKRSRDFFAELVKGLGPSPKFLMVLFATPREYWEERFAQFENEMNTVTPDGVTVEFELAMPDKFVDQINNNDVVYIPGGDDHLTKYWLSKYDLPKIWEGKVIGGSSAGSDVLVKHYWTCDWRQVGDGLGIVPIKFIPHFDSDYGSDDPYRGPIDWQKALEELKAYGEDLPIETPEEGEFVVIEQ